MLGVRFAGSFPDRVTQLILENPLGLENDEPAISPQSNADLIKREMPTLLINGQKDRTVFGHRCAPPDAIKGLGDFSAPGPRRS